ncbi:MAG: hypothetical protein KC503_02220 [Myxococcales bacterium]|nr:hypothetical protein [Myxococcales bacterium]
MAGRSHKAGISRCLIVVAFTASYPPRAAVASSDLPTHVVGRCRCDGATAYMVEPDSEQLRSPLVGLAAEAAYQRALDWIPAAITVSAGDVPPRPMVRCAPKRGPPAFAA